MDHDTVTATNGPEPETIQPLTLDEYLALPEDRGTRYELHQGRLVRMPVAGGSHDYIAFRLVLKLGAYVEARGLGAVTLSQAGYDVSEPGELTTVYIPDLAFVRAERVPAQASPEWSRPWKLAPDLVIEVVSPSQFHPETEQRAREWITRGARMVWVIWPAARSVDVWLPVPDAGSIVPSRDETVGVTGQLDGRDVIAGFACPVAELFKGVRADAGE